MESIESMESMESMESIESSMESMESSMERVDREDREDRVEASNVLCRLSGLVVLARVRKRLVHFLIWPCGVDAYGTKIWGTGLRGVPWGGVSERCRWRDGSALTQKNAVTGLKGLKWGVEVDRLEADGARASRGCETVPKKTYR